MAQAENFSLEIVVSVYKESLDWLPELRRRYPHARVVVYSKDPSNSLAGAISLSNVGRCDHTYLYHIVKGLKEGSLSDVTLFLPGSLYDVWKKQFAFRWFLLPRLSRKMSFASAILSLTKQGFSLLDYCGSAKVNYNMQSGCNVLPAKVRPFGAWWNSLTRGDEEVPWIVALWGVFAASREAIERRPLALWEELLSQMSEGDNLEAGHFMERSWRALLTRGPPTMKTN